MSKFDQQLKAAEKKRVGGTVVYSVAIGMALLVVIIFLGLTKTKINIKPIEQSYQASVSTTSGLSFYVGGSLYAFSDDLVVNVDSGTYELTNYKIPNSMVGGEVDLMLSPKKIKLALRLNNQIEADWFVNEKRVLSNSATLTQNVDAGEVIVEVVAKGYKRHREVFQLGSDHPVDKLIELSPVLFTLTVDSKPGGKLTVDGQYYDFNKPIQLSGPGHKLAITREGYFALEDVITPTPDSTLIERSYKLSPKPLSVALDLKPNDGVLIVNGLKVSHEMPEITVPYSPDYLIEYQKPGYKTSKSKLIASPGDTLAFKAHLDESYGMLVLTGTKGAEVTINGLSKGNLPLNLKLPTKQYSIKVVKPGYRSQERLVTFTSSAELKINFDLMDETAARLSEAKSSYTTSNGISMKLIKPRNKLFELGAPRHEKGQRANEFLRKIKLQRPFYVAQTELKMSDLPGGSGNDPITNKNWDAVAIALNQLSIKEKLEPFYKVNGRKVIGFYPERNGYRLISEAEWEYMARYHNRKRKVKYTWGDDDVVPVNAGNLADENASGSVSKYISGYRDAYVGAAPVGSFPKEKSGLYDLTGNVSEWVHDVYTLTPPMPGEVHIDPLGPQAGVSHVVKGSSFNSASVTELRASFRDGSESPRNDLGFRIARYL